MSASSSATGAVASVTRLRIRSASATTALAAPPIFDPSAMTTSRSARSIAEPLDLGLAIVELGEPPARAQPGGTDHGEVEPVAAEGRDRGRADAGQLVAADRAAERDDLDRPRPEQARDRQRGGHRDEARPDRQEPGELLGGRAHPDVDHPGIAEQPRRAHPDPALLAGVLEGAGVEGDVERPGEMRGRAAVRLADEPVALEQPDVAPDRHLGHVELSGELADVDRLLLGDPLEDPVASVDRRERARDRTVARGPASQHPTPRVSQTHNKD